MIPRNDRAYGHIITTGSAKTTGGHILMLGSEDDFATAMHRIREAISNKNYGELLSLDGLKIYDLPSTITDAQRIREIDLNNTLLESIDILGEMPWLQCIRLSNTNVTDLSCVAHIPGLLTISGAGHKGIYFRNTKITDQNVINISLIENAATRTKMLYDYYRFKDSSDSSRPEIKTLGDLPPIEPGINFEPNENYKFKPVSAGFLTKGDLEEIGDLQDICNQILDFIVAQTSTSNRFQRLNDIAKKYKLELSKIGKQISVDLLWAYGSAICGYESVIASLKNDKDFNYDYGDLGPSIAEFKAIHGALMLSTRRGKKLNERSFELVKEMNVDEYAEVSKQFTTSVLQSPLLTDEARRLVEQINDVTSIRASRMGAHSSAAASNNLIVAFAKTVIVWSAAGYVGNTAFATVPPDSLKLIAMYLINNATLISHVVAATGVNPAWVSAFIEWIQRNWRL